VFYIIISITHHVAVGIKNRCTATTYMSIILSHVLLVTQSVCMWFLVSMALPALVTNPGNDILPTPPTTMVRLVGYICIDTLCLYYGEYSIFTYLRIIDQSSPLPLAYLMVIRLASECRCRPC